ncbi:MAG: GtrA family protein [Patescibacteria group bacterium]|nr:GtrA family protein [Patescibacteria group bacterium]
MAGVVSAWVVLSTLYVLTDIVGLWYLASAVLGQVGGFFTNFFLQKYWTFKDYRKESTERQFKLFMAISAIHIMLNAIAMVVLVEVFRLWYVFAQVIVLASLALGSFLFHKKVTFKDNGNEDGTHAV